MKRLVVFAILLELVNAHELLANVNAHRYRPTAAQRALVLENYRRWGMPFENPLTPEGQDLMIADYASVMKVITHE